jgi:hypothetical protein
LRAFFALAHRSFINLAIFALAAGRLVPFRARLVAFAIAAILSATSAPMLASPSALIFRSFFGVGSSDGAVLLIDAHVAIGADRQPVNTDDHPRPI